jgi:hypothetical protein
MTTTTPESRARIAYTAYLRALHGGAPITDDVPTFDALPDAERAGWFNASRALWEIATTGRTSI